MYVPEDSPREALVRRIVVAGLGIAAVIHVLSGLVAFLVVVVSSVLETGVQVYSANHERPDWGEGQLMTISLVVMLIAGVQAATAVLVHRHRAGARTMLVVAGVLCLVAGTAMVVASFRDMTPLGAAGGFAVAEVVGVGIALGGARSLWHQEPMTLAAAFSRGRTPGAGRPDTWNLPAAALRPRSEFLARLQLLNAQAEVARETGVADAELTADLKLFNGLTAQEDTALDPTIDIVPSELSEPGLRVVSASGQDIPVRRGLVLYPGKCDLVVTRKPRLIVGGSYTEEALESYVERYRTRLLAAQEATLEDMADVTNLVAEGVACLEKDRVCVNASRYRVVPSVGRMLMPGLVYRIYVLPGARTIVDVGMVVAEAAAPAPPRVKEAMP